MAGMILADSSQAQTPTAAETTIVVAETAASGPSWMLIIVMGLAVMLAARPRKDPSDRLGG
ncbi:MAG: hypothetical protein AAFR65_09600 [Pseudomonadota bacterium]